MSFGVPAGVPLREFLHEAGELVQQAASASRSGPRQELGFVTAALRMGRGVMLGYGPSLAHAGSVQRLDLVQRLSAVLERLPELDVGGLKVMFGGTCGVDERGAVWLNDAGSVEEWARWVRVQESVCVVVGLRLREW